MLVLEKKKRNYFLYGGNNYGDAKTLETRCKTVVVDVVVGVVVGVVVAWSAAKPLPKRSCWQESCHLGGGSC